MVHDDAGVEVFWIVRDDNFIRSRDLSAFNCQFANAAQRKASEEFAFRNRCEYLSVKMIIN